MGEDSHKISPEEVLMNCLAGADRLDQVLILAYTKDGVYEYWSNDLPSHVRLGLLKTNEARLNRKFEELPEED